MVAPIVVGGNGYRWRGKSIRTIRKDNATCVTMPRRDSVVMAPVAVQPGTQYKVTINVSKSSGNGIIIVNFFGGKSFDGEPVTIHVAGVDAKDHTVAVSVPDCPKSIPIYFRVWKPNNSTGNIFVKNIRLEQIGNKLNVPREPRLEKVPSRHKSSVERPKPPRRKTKKDVLNPKKTRRPLVSSKEDKIMKFKPYESKKSTPQEALKVLISSPNDVPKVSIITPTRDGAELLEKCYRALDSNTSYPNWEWIIGDSVSEDGTAEMVKSWKDSRVKLVERGTTEGSFSSINNELVAYASGDYLLFLNNDTEPQPFWLFEMMSKIHRNPDIGIVGAKLLYAQQSVQHAGIAFIPQGPANIGKSVLKSFPKGFENQDRYLQAVTGACLLIRKEDFQEINGFDPIYYFCYEDVDLCLKVKFNLNKKILYSANSVLMHAESITQKKHKTSGVKQQEGIKVFKERWMKRVKLDFGALQKHANYGLYKKDISFVTCVNNLTQYRNYIIASLFNNKTDKNYEIIPILNFGNKYSAAQALNLGIEKANADIVVLCHQDVVFYENWINLLFDRISDIEENATKNWGVLGTAGITKKDDTYGVVHNLKGKLQWQASKGVKYGPVQTVDEHCMIIRKSAGLRFDEKTFNGFHMYGPDICLSALSRDMVNFGILCPLVHDSNSGSLISGKQEFMRLLNALANKWRPRFGTIRTPTSFIRKRSLRTFIRFKKQ